MIIIMKQGAKKSNIDRVIKKIKELKLKSVLLNSDKRAVIEIEKGERCLEDIQSLAFLPEVDAIVPALSPYILASREFKKKNTVIDLNGVKIGGKKIVVMAGPCAVESEKQIIEIAKAVKNAGAKVLRGGVFKPRASPYSFQGLGKKGLEHIKKAKEKTGLLAVTEVMDSRTIKLVSKYSDILQIGSRNMHNFSLLKEVSKTNKPILLKRGMSATLNDLLNSAEYILSGGNDRVILCERGIRTFEPYTRNTLDLNVVPAAKELTHLPMIVDPSHGTGRQSLVSSMSKAAIAAGADGLIIEVHPKPECALSDGQQSLTIKQFNTLMKSLGEVAKSTGRTI